MSERRGVAGVKALVMMLSVVIPAYNELERLPPYLAAIRDHLASAPVDGYEVIVVDDGSRDGMADLLRMLFGDWPRLRIEAHDRNRGKGAAVRTGVLAARGDLILFADADGATPIAEERKLRTAIDGGADIAVGSRLLTIRAVPVNRTMSRGIPGRIFACLVRSSFHLPIRDIQCGFKMFRRDIGRRLFESCSVDGYVFDVAILAAARRLGCRMVEVPIRWTEMPGSKFHLVSDSCRMAWGLLKLGVSSRDSDVGRWQGPESFAPGTGPGHEDRAPAIAPEREAAIRASATPVEVLAPSGSPLARSSAPVTEGPS